MHIIIIILVFCHGRPRNSIFALLPRLEKKSESDRAAIFCVKESGKKKKTNWADKLTIPHLEVVQDNCVAVILWLYSSVPESNLYCLLSSLLPFLPSCSHLGKHYFLGSFCFTGVSDSCVVLCDSLPCAFGFASYSWWYLSPLPFSPFSLLYAFLTLFWSIRTGAPGCS